MAESHEGDLDDEEDPHLQRSRDKGAHDYDPFNLEDIPDNEREEDAQDGLSLGNTRESLPLLLQSGWRQSQPRDPRPPSPPRSVDEEESDDDDELAFGLQMFEDDRPPQRTGQGLTESLLPRNAGDGTPFVFSLPKPDRVGRMKFNDVAWATVWRVSLATCAVGSVVTLFIPSHPSLSPGAILYTTLLHTIPLITLFTVIAALISYIHIALLRIAVKPVLMATSVAVPAIMIIAASWAFAGSFIWTGKEGGWAETVGLRLFALVPLVLAALSARSLYNTRNRLHDTISVVSFSARLLLEPGQLPLLALSPAVLLASILVSLPFLSLVFHLLLIGYVPDSTSDMQWHIRPYAGWLVCVTIFVWLWTWFIARGVLRMSVAATLGAWYFLDRRQEPHEEVKLVLFRATSQSLGTNCVSALVMTGIHVVTFVIANVTRITLPIALRPFVLPLAGPTTFITKSMASLSSYALVHAGITGEGFWNAARRAKTLTTARGTRSRSGYTLLTILLLLTAFAMGLLAAMATYLFTAFTLGSPSAAPFASFIGGTITALVGWFCMSLIDDVADSLFMCYCIDVDIGATHKPEVSDMFESTHAVTNVAHV